MMRKVLLLCLVAAAAICLMQATAQAAGYVLNPIADIWLREFSPDHAYDADFISVWGRNASPNEDGNKARYGVLSFDLSGITEPITSARLELYLLNTHWNTANACNQDAYLVTPAATDDSTLTWNSYYASIPVENQLEGLGVYDLPADNAVKQFYRSTATAADVALLEAQRTNGTAMFVFKAQDATSHEEEVTEIQGRREWADTSYIRPTTSSSVPPLMLINGTPIVVSVDTWLRESNGLAYENDLCSVWHQDSPGVEGQRVGILEFNLGQFASIESAKTVLFAIDNLHNAEAFEQQAYILNVPEGVNTADIDWAAYENMSKTPLDSLGHYLFGMDTDDDQYYESDAASSADLTALNTILQGDGKLVLALTSVPQEVTYMQTVWDAAGSRDWADTESTWAGYGDIPANQPEIWPRLVINKPLPKPGDANDDGFVDATDAAALATNWLLQSGATWAMGDFNGDFKVDDLDATMMAANWTGSAPSASVPEPGAFALLAAGLLCLLSVRRKW